ncbi:MAG: hypothetical protein WAL67_11255 [Candidatus Cybelea sp.]
MFARAALFASLAIAGLMAATPADTAVIVNSGSTNSYGYTIHVASDGKASFTLQRRGESAATTPKPFTVPAATAARFFSDLAAARKGNAAAEPCMKSASFGTSMHVTWQGWVSPDLSCPTNDGSGDALVRDIAAIRQAGGIPEMPLHPATGP